MTHVFISYVRENKAVVQKLCDELRSYGIEVWLDLEKILPGDRWQQKIRKAIEAGSFFIVCFSHEYTARDFTYLNEELTLAVEVLRKMPMERRWFIPVRLSDCSIPDRPIGGGETLRDLQWADLFSDWDREIRRIVAAIKPDIEPSSPTQVSHPKLVADEALSPPGSQIARTTSGGTNGSGNPSDPRENLFIDDCMENPVGHEINAMELATENDSVPTPQSLEKVEAEAEHQESFSKAGNNPDSLIADSIAGGYIEPRESPPRDCSECHGTGWRHVGGGFGSICYYCGGTGRRRY